VYGNHILISFLLRFPGGLFLGGFRPPEILENAAWAPNEFEALCTDTTMIRRPGTSLFFQKGQLSVASTVLVIAIAER